MARVFCAAQEFRELTGGLDTLDVPASGLRALLAELDRRHPGVREHVEQKMAVAIDGEIHQDALDVPLAADSEVVLIPRIGGG